jgi:hypothetical protein
LPGELARLDRVLTDEMLLWPIAQAWQDTARERGRPSIAMVTFVRLMVVKPRTGWGYETFVREVSDSLHLRRFCLIGIDQRVPDESTVRKLARRLGPEVVEEITRMVIERGHSARPAHGRRHHGRYSRNHERGSAPVVTGRRAAAPRLWRPRGPVAALQQDRERDHLAPPWRPGACRPSKT